MPNIATAYVQIVPTTQGIGNDLKTMLSGPASEAGESAGASAGGGFSKGLGTALKVGGAAAAALGAAVVGASGAVVKGPSGCARRHCARALRLRTSSGITLFGLA